MSAFLNSEYSSRLERDILSFRPIIIKAVEQVLLNVAHYYIPVRIGSYTFDFTERTKCKCPFKMTLGTLVYAHKIIDKRSLAYKIETAIRDSLFTVKGYAISTDVNCDGTDSMGHLLITINLIVH